MLLPVPVGTRKEARAAGEGGLAEWGQDGPCAHEDSFLEALPSAGRSKPGSRWATRSRPASSGCTDRKIPYPPIDSRDTPES